MKDRQCNDAKNNSIPDNVNGDMKPMRPYGFAPMQPSPAAPAKGDSKGGK